ncbi:MAG: discoidin domain-containing protein [Ignavibacteriales bacterium]|nr:discoidin domain-containing protein [Ignavibacteriales bacterium]
MKKLLFTVLLAGYSAFSPFSSAQTALEPFDSMQGWKTIQSADVSVSPSIVGTDEGKCMKLDINAPLAGFAGIQKNFALRFPLNYAFTYLLKTDLTNGTLEFTLSDKSGNPLYTYKKPFYSAMPEWNTITIKQKDLLGPWANPDIDRPAKQPEMISISLMLPPGSKGVVYIDELALVERVTPTGSYTNPTAFTSSSEKGFEAFRLFDKSLKSFWKSAGRQTREHVLVDFGETCEFGGLKIAWDSVMYAQEFTVSVSDNAKKWRELYSVKCGNNNISFIPVTDGEGRYIKLNLNKPNSKTGYIIKEIGMLPVQFSESMSKVYEEVKKMFPRGLFPAFFSNSPYSWKVFSAKNAVNFSAITENAELEIGSGSYLLEPFVYLDKQFITYAQSTDSTSGFADTAGSLKVSRTYLPCVVTVQPVIEDRDDTAYMHVAYTVKNTGNKSVHGSFSLAIRPFQVTGRNMFDGTIHGIGRIEELEFDGKRVDINKNFPLYPLVKPDRFGACEFNQGDVVLYLRNDSLPPDTKIKDAIGFASGALQYKLALKAGESKTFYFTVPVTTAFFDMAENNDKSYNEAYFRKIFKNFASKQQGILIKKP